MTPATATPPEAPDLDAILADAKQRVEELREQKERVSPEALIDAAAADELRSIESELSEAVRAQELAGSAKRELERREVEAREKAEADRIAAAEAQAQKLGSERYAAATLIDRRFREVAAALAGYQKLCEAHEGALAEAGGAGRGGFVAWAQPNASRIAGALGYWLREAHVRRGLLPLSGVLAGTEQPLADGEEKE
jgi:chromosome segregation ATPase